jgi:hypothetical protein
VTGRPISKRNVRSTTYPYLSPLELGHPLPPSREISIFNIQSVRLTAFDIQFVSLSKYNSLPANYFDLRDFFPFALFQNFLFRFYFTPHLISSAPRARPCLSRSLPVLLNRRPALPLHFRRRPLLPRLARVPPASVPSWRRLRVAY